MNIVQLLVGEKIISKEDASKLEADLKISGEKPEEMLLAKKMVNEHTLFGLKSKELNIPFKDIDSADDIPLRFLELIPEDSAKYYKMAPIGQQGEAIEIGMVYPEDLRAQDALKFLAHRAGFSYHIALIAPKTFEKVLKQYQNLKREMHKALEELEQEIKQEHKEPSGETQERFVEEAPISKMVAVILRNAVEGGASDIHIEPTKENVRVRFRFLGELHPSLLLPSKVHQQMVARIKILARMKIDERRIPQDGRFSAPVGDRMIDFRVATFPTPLGEKVALRVLDPAAGFKSFEDLGIEGVNLAMLKAAVKKPYGLILVTGPTGSGKSTTLYSILRYLNSDSVNIISLEDPVEYFIEGVNQSQIHPEIGYDFAQGLRQILRQDPNIIMVGEVRDNETATLVIHAALTGHVVLSTLHTNNAAGVVPRLLDMGVDKFLIPATLSLAISQRLVRRLCDVCKEKKKLDKSMESLLAREIEQLPQANQKEVQALFPKGKEPTTFEPKGCKKCGSSGFAGRIAIMEVLAMTKELSQVVLSEPSEEKIVEEAQRQGAVTIRQDGILKVLNGATTLEEVLRATQMNE